MIRPSRFPLVPGLIVMESESKKCCFQTIYKTAQDYIIRDILQKQAGQMRGRAN